MECNPMKTTIFLPLMLCCVVAAAQDNTVSQTLPELQEWYSIKGGVSALVSYLPGFDSVGGGLNAITHTRRNSDPVFYNRFPFDTASQFQWKPGGGEIVVQIDFNNDGIHDYVDYRGRLYTGSKKGEKPNSEPIRTLTTRIADRNFIHDFNNDSYPDVMIRNGAGGVEILFGNKELTQIKRTIKSYPRAADFIGGYSNEHGKPRMILYSHEDYTEGFYLYGIRSASKGDSTEIFLDELDKIEIQKLTKDEPAKFISNSTMIYQEKSYSVPFVNIFKNKNTDTNEFKSYGYVIQDDKFIKSRNNAPGVGKIAIIGGSIDGDSIPDIFQIDIVTIDGKSSLIYQCYSGNPLYSNGKPVMCFIRDFRCLGNSGIQYIGDVNKDGIGDIAYGGSDGCFSVYLGLDWRKVGVNDIAEFNSFKIHQNIPNPVHKDRKTLLPVSLNTSGKYSLTLYDVQGNTIKELFVGELSEGDHKIPLDLMGLSAGMYVVKMSNGSVSRERAIMIGE